MDYGTHPTLRSESLIVLDDHNDHHRVKVGPIINIKRPVSSFDVRKTKVDAEYFAK